MKKNTDYRKECTWLNYQIINTKDINKKNILRCELAKLINEWKYELNNKEC